MNLVLNPSFETDDDDDSVPDAWTLTGGSAYDVTGNVAEFGSSAGKAGSSGVDGIIYQSGIPIQTSTFLYLVVLRGPRKQRRQ